jgi:hypothetical protein
MSSRARTLVALLLAGVAVGIAVTAAVGSAAAHPGASSEDHEPTCFVPHLLGFELRLARKELLSGPVHPGCKRSTIARVRIRHPHRRGALVVIAQTPTADIPATGASSLTLTVEASPQLPHGCIRPAFYEAGILTRELIVWQVTTLRANGSQLISLYGCVPPTGAKRFLGRVPSPSLWTIFANGPFSALVRDRGSAAEGASIDLENVLSGESNEVFVGRAGSEQPQPAELAQLGPPVGTGALLVLIDARGDLAWIGRTPGSATHPGELVLYLRDSLGIRRLAVGRQLSNLVFNGTQLTWLSSGVTETAPV